MRDTINIDGRILDENILAGSGCAYFRLVGCRILYEVLMLLAGGRIFKDK